MKRGALLLLGLALLAAGVLLLPAPQHRSPRLLVELGRSLGGAGVLAVDALFLRADQLRAAGRPEEVPALYQAALELDPQNAVAADFLLSVLAVDLVNDAPTTEERLAWWTEAWTLLDRMRALHPTDPSLAMRGADLLLDVPLRHPDLLPGVTRAVGDVRGRGLAFLLEAAERTATLPRRGRQHLEWLAFLVPVIAAERGPGTARQEILALGEGVLERRRDALESVRALKPGEGGELEGVPMARILARGLEAVRAFDAAEAGGDGAAARAVLGALEAELPDLPLVEVLRARAADMP